MRHLLCYYQHAENYTHKLREVIGWTETNIYFLANIFRKCDIAVPLTITRGLIMFGN
jgi:hypothetical protein